MSTATVSLNENRILSALPAEEGERLSTHLEPVSLKLSQILFRPGERIRYAYFPTNSIISLLTDLEDGSGMEVGLVGREGLAGISIILGGTETKVGTVQGEGDAFRINAATLREAFHRGGALQAGLLRYTHALMTQISQSVVCNARHQIDGRLARWLLMYHDRIGRDEFALTHEFMANMLGVRRAGVSMVANRLQQMGFIRYKRGRITILNRAGLEAFTCECYPAVKEKYDDFLL
ncbi:MAG TPA: Crp/Fnr family transcriptional regulator, partial [Pyrinomonadaceae bacterium]|nr:Crp/Fnr family transcriptional regulator [Pyrinomonadaceae bacterium]